jgi:hypothetical protein
MKRKVLNPIIVMVLLFATLFATNSCSDLLNNPMKDKDTGEDLTLLLLDLNVFDTKITVIFQDSLGRIIDTDNLIVSIFGQDADKIVDLDGKKASEFKVKNGILEIALDPTYVPSESKPIEFSVYAETEEYKWYSIPQEVFLTETGENDVLIEMIYEGEGELKSAFTTLTNPPFTFSYPGIPASDITKTIYSPVKIIDGMEYFYDIVPKSKTKVYTTTIAATNSAIDSKIYSDWGFNGSYKLSNNILKCFPSSPLTRSANLANIKGFRFFTADKKTGVSKCPAGLTVKIKESTGKNGTGTFNYKLKFSDGSSKSGSISGSFTSANSYTISSTINPIYYPTSNANATLEITPPSSYTIDKTSVGLTTACSSTVEIKATPKVGLKPYKVITTISCERGGVGAAPSMRGTITGPGLDRPTSFLFDQGIATFQLKENENYNISGSYNGTSASFGFTTKNSPAAIKSVVDAALAKYPDLKNVTIVFDGKEANGTSKIKIGVVFKQDKCPF